MTNETNTTKTSIYKLTIEVWSHDEQELDRLNQMLGESVYDEADCDIIEVDGGVQEETNEEVLAKLGQQVEAEAADERRADKSHIVLEWFNHNGTLNQVIAHDDSPNVWDEKQLDNALRNVLRTDEGRAWLVENFEESLTEWGFLNA